MSSDRKSLKVLALLLLLTGILALVLAFMRIAGVTDGEGGFDVEALVGCVIAVLGLACGALGVQAANVPARAKPCVGMDAAGTIGGAALIAFSVATGASWDLLMWFSCLVCVLALVSWVFAVRVRNRDLDKA